MDAILDDTVFHTDDLSQDPRWPEYGRRAAELGWVSMISYRLSPEVTGTGILAGLNIYSDQRAAFDSPAAEVGP